jgi:hypothetical protein
MNTLEDRIRAATRATAAEIAPGSIPPLALEARRRRRGKRHQWPVRGGAADSRPGWRPLLIPAAAAAAVVAVVAAALVVTHAAIGGAQLPAGTFPLAAAPTSATGTGGSNTGGTGTGARDTQLSALPPYYVSLEPGPLSDDPTRAVVRATATGKALATVTPPSPYPNFVTVTAAADDRTFVLAAANDGALQQEQLKQATRERGSLHRSGSSSPAPATVPTVKFFLLRLDPAAGTATLSQLPIAGEPASEIINIALAPDGSKLAIALGEYGEAEQEITVVSLRTGSARTWQGQSQPGGPGIQGDYYLDAVVLGANPLSWTADGRTLAFEEMAPLSGQAQPGQPLYSIKVRLLDTAAPGDDLWSSRAVAISGSSTNAMITPDGTTIVAPLVTQTSRQVAEYSASTGLRTRVMGVRDFHQAYDGGAPRVFWTSPSGSTVIVYDAKQGSPLLTSDGGLTPFVLAAVTGSQFTPLPGSDPWGAW